MIFDCGRIAERGGEVLDMTGAHWTEARSGLEWCLDKVSFFVFSVSVVITVIALILTFSGANALAGVFFGVVLFAGGYGLMVLALHLPGRRRELNFLRDGTVYAPVGLSTWPLGRSQFTLPHIEIRSIEAEQLVQPKGDDMVRYTHGVRVFFYGGQVGHVAKNLEPDDAHMLAVTLTHALAELRQSLSSRARPLARSRERVID